MTERLPFGLTDDGLVDLTSRIEAVLASDEAEVGKRFTLPDGAELLVGLTESPDTVVFLVTREIRGRTGYGRASLPVHRWHGAPQAHGALVSSGLGTCAELLRQLEGDVP